MKAQRDAPIPSLDAVVLVEHRRASTQLWTRDEHGWTLNTFSKGETVSLVAISANLNVDDVYAAASGA